MKQHKVVEKRTIFKPIATVTVTALIGVIALTNLPSPYNFLVGLGSTFAGGMIYHHQIQDYEKEKEALRRPKK